jgi:hypothetical protein
MDKTIINIIILIVVIIIIYLITFNENFKIIDGKYVAKITYPSKEKEIPPKF